MSDESPVFEKIPVGAGELFTLRVDNINDFNGINVVPHFHMMDELMWFRESEGSYSIGDEKFTVKNNTLIFVPALLIHEMTLPAAASRAAILGVAWRASWLQPPVSRMFTKRITEVVAPASSASAVNSCFSWVQATTRSSPWARACMNAGASRRHKVE